jgi:hypothetical protein
MASPQALLLELKAQVDGEDVDGGFSTLSKIKVRNLESRKPPGSKVMLLACPDSLLLSPSPFNCSSNFLLFRLAY